MANDEWTLSRTSLAETTECDCVTVMWDDNMKRVGLALRNAGREIVAVTWIDEPAVLYNIIYNLIKADNRLVEAIKGTKFQQ